MESVNFVLLWIILISCGLRVPCRADSCNSTTLDCPKIVRVQTQVTKQIPSTCHKTERTCWGWNVFKIKCKYKQRSSECPKQIYYFETITKKIHGCCPGYYQESDCCIKEQCRRGFWGQNCTQECTTCKEDSYEKCGTNGTCLCKPGWIGSNCAEQCKPGTYGVDCQWNCSCDNNATCHHVTGECNCTTIAGWTGERCDVECEQGSFGNNCTGICDCEYENQECDKTTGECRCLSGKTGRDCSLNCSTDSFTFGSNCTESCRCIPQNSLSCDPVSGRCGCKAGWKGDRCERNCDASKYGKGCLRNCTCNDKEICNSVNGTCLLTDVCFADYTSNCIPQKNVSCAQFMEDYRLQIIERNNSIMQTISDICFMEKNLQTLCLSTGECKCLMGYSGKRCQNTTTLEQRSEQPVMVVLPIAILVIVVVIVTVLVICKKQRLVKRSSRKTEIRYTNNKAYGERCFETVKGTSNMPLNKLNSSRNENLDGSEEYDVVNRQSQSLNEEKSEIYSSNRNAESDYDYNTSRTVEVKEDNYSSAMGGDTYSHLRGSSVTKKEHSQLDDTYSHAQLTQKEDEQNKDGGHASLSDDYDHTDIQCQMYSNTGHLHEIGENVNNIY